MDAIYGTNQQWEGELPWLWHSCWKLHRFVNSSLLCCLFYLQWAETSIFRNLHCCCFLITANELASCCLSETILMLALLKQLVLHVTGTLWAHLSCAPWESWEDLQKSSFKQSQDLLLSIPPLPAPDMASEQHWGQILAGPTLELSQHRRKTSAALDVEQPGLQTGEGETYASTEAQMIQQ